MCGRGQYGRCLCSRVCRHHNDCREQRSSDSGGKQTAGTHIDGVYRHLTANVKLFKTLLPNARRFPQRSSRIQH